MASPFRTWLERVEGGFGLALGGEARERLEALDALLVEWQRAVRLTGYRDERARWQGYFAEALRAVPWIRPGAHVDVGSGGGTPGLVLAVAVPDSRWTLLEPRGRKAVFLEIAAETLGLSTVEVRRGRAEEYAPEGSLAGVTSRGLALEPARLARLWSWLAPGGRLLLWKGPREARAAREAIAALPGGGQVEEAPLGAGAVLLVAERDRPAGRFT